MDQRNRHAAVLEPPEPQESRGGALAAGVMDVIIVDDEPAGRRTLRELCRAEGDLEVVGEYGDGNSALEAVRSLRRSCCSSTSDGSAERHRRRPRGWIPSSHLAVFSPLRSLCAGVLRGVRRRLSSEPSIRSASQDAEPRAAAPLPMAPPRPPRPARRSAGGAGAQFPRESQGPAAPARRVDGHCTCWIPAASR